MPEETPNLEENLEKVFKGITAVQERLDKVDGKMDAMDKEMIEKASAEAAEALEVIAAAEAKVKEEEKRAEEQEIKIADMQETIVGLQRGNSGDGDNEEYKHDFARYLRKGTMIEQDILEAQVKVFLEKNTFGLEERDIDLAAKDLLAGSGPDGGYFLTTDRSSKMSKRIFETSPLRGVANTETTTSDMFEIILDDDESASGFVGEVDSRTDTATPQIGLIKIPMHEIFAQPRITQKLLDDAGFDVEGWLAGKVARQIGRGENTSFVSGDGSQKPKGFLDYADRASADVYERNTVQQVTSGTSADFDADDLINLQNTLFEEYQIGATWGMKRATFTKVAQLKDGQGQYLLSPRVLKEGSTKVLLGANLIFMDDMPAVAANSLSIVIADFSEFYTIVDRFDIRILRDPFTAKPHIRFYTTKRVGGAVTNFEAGKLLKLST